MTFRAVRLCILLCLLLPPLHGFAQSCPPESVPPTPEQMQTAMRDARDRGFLWKFGRAGRIGYLYGSMHLGKQAWFFPGPKTMAAIRSADTVALELDLLDPAIQSQMANPARFAQPVTLPPTLRARLEAVARKACAPQQQATDQHPIIRFLTIAIADARFSGLEITWGSEIFLTGFARALNKPVISLETVEGQLRALTEGTPAEIIQSLDRGLATYEQGKARAVTERMINNWATSNLEDLKNYAQWCECANTALERKILARLNDARNPALAAAINQAFRSGKTVFAAVGALHMTGPKALPKLLHEMGYTVERVSFAP